MKSKAFTSALVMVALSSSLSAAAEKVTIMYTATAAFASAFVAKDRGFFEKHGDRRVNRLLKWRKLRFNRSA